MEDAEALLRDARKAEAPGRTLLFFSTPPDWAHACELYAAAGNAFKAGQAWARAAEAYAAAAAAAARADEPVEHTRMLMAAAGAYRNCDAAAAVRVLEEAASLFLARGRFEAAAAAERDAGALCEEALGDAAGAMRLFQAAADRYRGENQVASARACQLRVAALAADSGEHGRAADIFEAAALASAGDAAGRYAARDLLLRAGLCRLASGDSVAARRAIDGYGAGVDSSFGGTPEETFLKELLAALEGDDAERLGAAVDSFSRRSTLDAWKLRLLSSVRASLVAAEASDLM